MDRGNSQSCWKTSLCFQQGSGNLGQIQLLSLYGRDLNQLWPAWCQMWRTNGMVVSHYEIPQSWDQKPILVWLLWDHDRLKTLGMVPHGTAIMVPVRVNHTPRKRLSPSPPVHKGMTEPPAAARRMGRSLVKQTKDQMSRAMKHKSGSIHERTWMMSAPMDIQGHSFFYMFAHEHLCKQ